MKTTAAFFSRTATAALLVSVGLFVTACDTTPRERQDAVREGAREIDTMANEASAALKRVGSRAARWDSISRIRNRQPLDTTAGNAFMTELLGPYASIEQLTADNIDQAYAQFLRQVRAKRRDWTQRDWDYATAVFNQLNARYRTVRLDLPARREFRIKALQTEFSALEAGRDLSDLREAVREERAR